MAGRSRKLRRVFLLSPARVDGVRAGYMLNPDARFELAQRFRREGLPLAEVFTFTSGLYFRGKITYARTFASASDGDVVRVITSNAGLEDPDRRLSPEDLRGFGDVPIDPAEPRYHEPLRRDARALARGARGRARPPSRRARGERRLQAEDPRTRGVRRAASLCGVRAVGRQGCGAHRSVTGRSRAFGARISGRKRPGQR